jgi:3-phenylpropionate/trans-cinnamate dioxygenase ferredoxin subunit
MPPVRVASLEELPSGAKRAVTVEGTPILVVNVEGEYFALNNICSHAYAQLSHGELDCDELTIECPLHGSLFDLRTGRPRTLPAFEPVATYRAYAEGDAIFVEYSE